jgi:hypothetical protein
MMIESQANETSKLSLVVRRPQEGKTGICINSITRDKSRDIHVVLTMNTIPSSCQFFGRMLQEIGPKKIVVFNSNKKSAGECHHAKDIERVIRFINEENIKVVVACSHVKRFREGLPYLLKWAQDSIRMTQGNVKFIIHIDEAHKYIPENIVNIRAFDESPVVSDIIGYTATPDGIWSDNPMDPLFHKILIRDVEKELEIIRSPKYFGVGRCETQSFDQLNEDDLIRRMNISLEIPKKTIRMCGSKFTGYTNWYNKLWSFDLGDELLQLSFIDFLLPNLSIPRDSFTYNFIPSYTRKVTHYQSMEIILKHYPTANVIVMNGNGFQLFRLCEDSGDESDDESEDESDGESEDESESEGDSRKLISKCISCTAQVYENALRIEDEVEKKRVLDGLLEPSFMIEALIKDNRDFPTFVTGFTCVGMSVTLINQSLGNFDNVIMVHQHYGRDKLYQLCRFLFNYERWEEESISKIKRTKLFSLRETTVSTCLEYEAHIQHMCNEFSGKRCSLREVMGLDPVEPSEREIKHTELVSVKLKNSQGKIWKKFKVYDGNDAEQWENVSKFYQEIRGKRLNKVSMPKKVDGFYTCSDATNVGVKTIANILILEKEKWTTRFQLKMDQLSYVRVFVGYDNVDDPSEYTIFVKYVELENSPENIEILRKYGIKNKKQRGLDRSDDECSDNGSDID